MAVVKYWMLRGMLLFSLICSGCVVQHPNADDVDLVLLAEIRTKLQAFDEGLILRAHWPDYLKSLNPSQVRKVKAGIYLRLETFIFEESGLFLAFGKQILIDAEDHNYILIGDDIYSYYIKA